MEAIISFFSTFPQGSLPLGMWWIFVHGGFIIVAMVALKAAFDLWVQQKQHEFIHSVPFVLLAIDVPKDTEQGPLAVEHIFSTLFGTYGSITLYEKIMKGKHQLPISFELVSLGGYIQYLVYTPVIFRDLIEACIYSQYPDAEITEVEDYVQRIPLDFDTDAYDLWGCEFALVKPDGYPIKTYPEFEDKLKLDFKDPMAAVLEVLGRIGPDEDVWLQIVITTPGNKKWQSHITHAVHDIMGSGHAKFNIFEFLIFKLPLQALDFIGEIIYPLWGDIKEEKKEARKPSDLTPGERNVLEAVQRKISKICYFTKFRMIYWGRRESFAKGLGVSGVVGSLNQFNAPDRNAFKPGKGVTTQAEYFLKESRITRKQRSILLSYQTRSAHRGLGHGIILNTEELATIWHFPVVTVKAPLVKKTAMKKAEPPFALPTYGQGYLKSTSGVMPVAGGGMPQAGGRSSAPTNLPWVEEESE
ncbi:MAG: hypothetical protein AAB657_00020 [Patescibacteria group bacterium]